MFAVLVKGLYHTIAQALLLPAAAWVTTPSDLSPARHLPADLVLVTAAAADTVAGAAVVMTAMEATDGEIYTHTWI